METIDVLLLEKPYWLELPEEEKEKHTYWACLGKHATKYTGQNKWITIFHDKEMAECFASIPKENWVWNGNPAIELTLQQAMFNARKFEARGVKIKGYQNGEWVTLKMYPAEVPLGDTI